MSEFVIEIVIMSREGAENNWKLQQKKGCQVCIKKSPSTDAQIVDRDYSVTCLLISIK